MNPGLVLHLTAFGQPRRYQVRTTTAVQVGAMKFENELLYVVEQTVLGNNERGYLLQIDVVHAIQQATDLFSRVTADLNQATRRLVLQTDLHGQLLRVENQPEVLRAWQAMRKAVQAKYAAEPTVRPYLDAFEQQLAVPDSMAPNLRNKGLYGALLPKVYGQAYAKEPVHSRQQISGFFHDIDLPLTVATTAQPTEETAFQDAVQVTATASLDAESFAATDFRRLMRSIVDDYKFPVDLTLTHRANHLLAARTGELLRSQQQLAAEVPGVYLNRITHDVFPQPPTA
ncbi:hypothetical protein [Hymenobacter terrenus]|uniref:hypothetical protein n=1 Tax=Hymenobacter terrenus TaxID=1629124 RepID=UPI0006196398|nr:hypothetical protein [Hymenobacter terrenus]